MSNPNADPFDYEVFAPISSVPVIPSGDPRREETGFVAPSVTEVVYPERSTPAAVPSPTGMSESSGLEDYEGSLFSDSPDYYLETLKVGQTTIFIRDLDEEVLKSIAAIPDEIAAATENRISRRLVEDILKYGNNPPPELEAELKAARPADAAIVSSKMNSIMDAILIGGINKWTAPEGTINCVPCTDDRKVKVGRHIRAACVAKILEVSGFGDREGAYFR